MLLFDEGTAGEKCRRAERQGASKSMHWHLDTLPPLTTHWTPVQGCNPPTRPPNTERTEFTQIRHWLLKLKALLTG